MLHAIIGRPNSLRRIYGFSILLTIGSFIAATVGLGPAALFTVVVLTALEVTFSFDNAVVNAKILARMPAFWRQMFMTVGIFIAVFGMRLVLPIVLVAVTASLDVFHVVDLALSHPEEYAHKIHEAHPIIAAFGGMFLLLLFLEFMLDDKREVHWINIIEKPFRRAGRLRQLEVIISLVVLLLVTETFGHDHKAVVLSAGLAGMLTFLIVRALSQLFERRQQHAGLSHRDLMRAGFFNFLYLEVIDASFSFDGVIGAFAITKSVLLIALGLGVGAIWVRSMTVHMVRRHTLGRYRYLEHGAHYAIGALAVILLVGIGYEIPEAITGTLGISIVAFAFLSSWLYNRRLRTTGALSSSPSEG